MIAFRKYQNRERIVPFSKKAVYLEARRLVAEKGMKFPSHVLLDDYLKTRDM